MFCGTFTNTTGLLPLFELISSRTSSDEEYLRFRDFAQFYNDRLDTRVSRIYRAVFEGDLQNVQRCIERGESVNKTGDLYRFSPLHVAVLKNNVEILEYLLTREDVDVDVSCRIGRTPLYMAIALGRIELVERLIRAGSNVNFRHYRNNSPLDMSVYHPDICHLLIQRGAQIDAVGKSRNTLLDKAVERKDECLGIVHMLLYYNADANVRDRRGFTPFMTALLCGNVPAQEALLDYVVNFNETSDPAYFSTLSLALHTNSPFAKEIIKRGADVNYGDNPEVTHEACAFTVCSRRAVNSFTFKMVWERLRYNHAKNTVDLHDLFRRRRAVPRFLQVIIESNNFEPAVEYFSKGKNYLLFVDEFAKKKFELEQLTRLTCRLLEYGFRATTSDIHAILSHYGYCELFRILLHMDNDFTQSWRPFMVLTRLIFDIDYDLESAVDGVNDIPKENFVQLLEYSICPRLMDALTIKYTDDEDMTAILGGLPRVPSLMELARNAARKHVWRAFKITNACQFYTTIDHLDIPAFYKNILTFKRKMYVVER
ncbi:uncharacterized protein LOC108916673 [Anoplophora glabripennis]|uniref:uncharacterized protein LOC108916673 n=1 Tax=Anoplophora glabripennis TaxID=217634 RepID=UPI000C76B7A4|nr:uncharacterized protein LOC108916673 [Anoplophora glabripennis]